MGKEGISNLSIWLLKKPVLIVDNLNASRAEILRLVPRIV